MHLFAGAGGGLLADLILGHKPIIAVEWDKYACRVLRERAADGWFPDLRVWEGDVRMFDPSDYAGRVDSIAAGFPCQDISQAGNQAGLGEGTRSGLYREVLRIADVVRPQYLFLENVAAILANEHLGTVLGDLAARGYDARWCCLEASGVGAPHKRDRWWMLASLADAKSTRAGEHDCGIRKGVAGTYRGKATKSPHPNRERQLQPQGIKQDERGRSGDLCADVADACGDGGFRRREREMCGIGLGRGKERIRGISIIETQRCGKDVADTNAPGFQEQHPSAFPDDPRPSLWCLDAGRREGPIKPDMGLLADELAPHVDWWSIEPDIGRVATGILNRAARLKALGNGQVPLQAAIAWMILGGPITQQSG